MSYVIFSLTLRNWIPTFSVLMNYQTKEEAAALISITGMSQLIFRFVLTCLNLKLLNFFRIVSVGLLLYSPIILVLYLL